MSLRTWKSEFLPITARRAAERYGPIKCIEHSLQKWKGALPENTKKHGVEYGAFPYSITETADKSKEIEFDSETCALCEKFFDSVEYMNECDACPIVVSGNHSCMETRDKSAYIQSCSNPNQMIAVLEHTLQFYKNGNHKKVIK